MIGQLTNHLFQSTLFALAAALLVLAFRKNRARVRYSLWLIASLKFLIPFSMLIALGSQIHWTPAHAIVARAALPELPDVVQTIEQFSEPFTVAIPASQRQTDRGPLAIVVMWFCGLACVMVLRVRAWRGMRIAIRRSQPLDLGLPIEARLSSGVFEPGIVGLWRPMLLLPQGIIERLTPSELEAVIAHELCHIRRRDNLFAAIHMLIEALFWFHPLVWWIGAHLLDERERACDEEVISLGNQPEIYADAILSVCKLYTGSSLACVSGVTGADIRRRLEAIMSNQTVTGLTQPSQLMPISH
jgi:beta-lactamase regulating signal transducer with metallopeptidase domain